jgi:UDP-N-acetylglucosamine 2-epimerase (non-hydrolysing)
MKIACVVGARPNFMKIAPLLEEMAKYPKLNPLLVHTGQHYDYEMSQIFFDELKIPKPDVHLGIGSGSHAVQTANIMIAFEKTVNDYKPDLILVVGDVNSTLACALVASKLCIPIAHVEAGLRSFDKTMPEEINRIVTDVLSDYLFTTTEEANENLKREGIAENKIFFVGNIMVDTLLKYKEKAESIPILNELRLEKNSYVLMTLHRQASVDIKENLLEILDAVEKLQSMIKVVLVIHPRTKTRIEDFGLKEKVSSMNNLMIIKPLGYLSFIGLMKNSKFVLSDSGGMQTETTVLNIPCLTMRDNTEMPETVSEGTNILVGNNTDTIIQESIKIIEGKAKSGKTPKMWDGRTSERIVSTIISIR